MQFLYPGFLFALVAIAIPVIIHLFNFRRYKTILFSNVKFLQIIQQETKSRSQLRQWLILLARILAIAALVLAFAQPYIPVKDQIVNAGDPVVGIYIDNSYSMDAAGEKGILLEEAKLKARKIMEAFQPSTKFLLITNDFEPRHQQLFSKEQLPNGLAEIKSSPYVRMLSQVVSRIKLNFQSQSNIFNQELTVFIISDFQKSSSDFDKFLPDSLTHLIFIPLSNQITPNVYIDSCWFASPVRKYNQEEKLKVRIVNQSEEEYQDFSVKLFINDSLKGVSSVDLELNQSKTIELAYNSLTKGIHFGRVEISDYPVVFDNRWYFSYYIASHLNILELGNKIPSPYLQALYKNDPYFRLGFYSFESINYSDLFNNNVVIVNQSVEISSGLGSELKKFLLQGGSVVVIPAINADLASYNPFFFNCKTDRFSSLDSVPVTLRNLNVTDPVLNQVFSGTLKETNMPIVLNSFSIEHSQQSGSVVLISDDHKRPMLSKVQVGKGILYAFMFPFDPKYSSFVKHGLFVPVMYNIGLMSQPQNRYQYKLGIDNYVLFNAETSDKNLVTVKSIQNKTEFIPSQRSANTGVMLNMEPVSFDGHYLISNRDSILGSVSYNYDRKESDLKSFSPGEISEEIAKFKLINTKVLESESSFIEKQIQQMNHGTQLWKWFILFALLFLSSEMLMIRLWK